MRPKIVHLIGQLVRGGAERQLLLTCQALKARGWDQTIVTFDPGQPWDTEAADLAVPLRGIARHVCRPWRLWRLGRWLWHERPALVHSWSHHTNVYAGYLRCLHSTPLVVSFRSNPVVDTVSGNALRDRPGLWVYERADCVVSNSEAALEAARDAGVRMRRHTVVGNMVVARARANPGAPVLYPRLAAAGALTRLKAYDVLLTALSLVAKEGRHFELLLAGDGPERAALEALAARLGLRTHVRFLGDIDDVPASLARAHMLVHPSRSEGLSNTVLEGMAEGLVRAVRQAMATL